MLSKTNIVVFSLALVILILLGILIFRKPETIIEVEPFDDTQLKEEILQLTSDNTRLATRVTQLQQERDSIGEIKAEVKIIYREKIKHISTAGLTKLDSIIRSSIN